MSPGRFPCDSADDAAGQLDVRCRDAQADSIGKAGHDRERFAESVLADAYSDGEEGRRRG